MSADDAATNPAPGLQVGPDAATPAVGDVEALARVLHDARQEAFRVIYPDAELYRWDSISPSERTVRIESARYLLNSDWLAKVRREAAAEAWEEGAICRAQADPATSVRDLNPYRAEQIGADQ